MKYIYVILVGLFAILPANAKVFSLVNYTHYWFTVKTVNFVDNSVMFGTKCTIGTSLGSEGLQNSSTIQFKDSFNTPQVCEKSHIVHQIYLSTVNENNETITSQFNIMYSHTDEGGSYYDKLSYPFSYFTLTPLEGAIGEPINDVVVKIDNNNTIALYEIATAK